MTRGIRYSPEVCERAVWMVEEQRADYGSEWGDPARLHGLSFLRVMP